MKLELIKTESGVILVSDEEIKEGNYKYYPKNKAIITHNSDMSCNGQFKVIAGHADLPKVDLSAVITHAGESKTIAEWIGVWDVEKFASSEWDSENELYKDTSNFFDYEWGYKKGFAKRAELTKEKKFTEEDMIRCWNECFFTSSNSKLDESLRNLYNFLSSLRPNSWEVEVEMEIVEFFISEHDFGTDLKPRITNGTIKVTNIKL